ncbi:MAG: hypothetical protein M0Z57_03245 [Deltaproteobacteria bacterium]|nr:hypothetical protein [Deltaproteobacteria bacterium]MDA8299004.1 hypothetical protein [Deltaproteobacteria bacterium]
MKLKKIITAVLLSSILGLFAGLLLTGCSGTNQALEKDHIMNDGCFITCYNNAHNDKVAKKNADGGKYADYSVGKYHSAHNDKSPKKIYG